jgi:parallel beta-helix repeat protein
LNTAVSVIALAACLLAAEARASVPMKVGSLESLAKAISKLGPGATIVVADGTHTTARPIRIEGKRGTAEAPITVRAEHRGKAVIGGLAGFLVRDCEHLILEGFDFAHDSDQNAVLLENCRHVRVTRSAFHLQPSAKPRHIERWVFVIGTHSGNNRIDHNLFEHKVNPGSFVFVRGDDAELICSQHDRVDHNYFRDVAYGGGPKRFETIRTGGNDLGASGRGNLATIEYNLLERCSGEQEIMSLKSSDNIVRGNTLLNCRGSICLRLGNRNVVTGNFVITTDGGPGHGGVKLYGFDHRVFNNYFCGLTGIGHEAPLALIPGTLDTPTTDRIGKQYQENTSVPATRAWIAFNTWIDCAPLGFGSAKPDPERTQVPHDCTFVDNLVVRTRPQSAPLVSLGLVHDLKAHDNLGYAGAAPPGDTWAGWFRWADPRLRSEKEGTGLWRLTAGSPALDAAADDSMAIDRDVFGRPRTGRPDIGAEEYSKTAVVRGPLTPQDVGPDAPDEEAER